MQRSVRVQHLHLSLDDVVPLHAQVNEASGLDLVSFPIEDVMPCCLVLDCCNQSLLWAADKAWNIFIKNINFKLNIEKGVKKREILPTLTLM